MKSSDDHERYLGGEEDSNDYNQHQGGALCISLLSAFSDQAPAEIAMIVDQTSLAFLYQPSSLLMG